MHQRERAEQPPHTRAGRLLSDPAGLGVHHRGKALTSRRDVESRGLVGQRLDDVGQVGLAGELMLAGNSV